MNINYELYKFFYFAAKNSNFSKAAQELFVSQSSVSQAIKKLEKQLDTNLFFKSGRNVELTKEGKTLFSYVSKAYNALESGEKEIDQINNLDGGSITIGVSDTICKYYLLPYIKEFHTLYPNIKIIIKNRPSPVSLDGVKKGELDLGIINTSNQDLDTLDVSIFKTFKDVFIASNRYFDFKASKTYSLKELLNYPIISLEKTSSTRRFLNEYMKNKAVDFQPEFELDSIDLILRMTAMGMGIGYVPEFSLENNDDLIPIQLKKAMPTRDIALITNKNIPTNKITNNFIRIILNNY